MKRKVIHVKIFKTETHHVSSLSWDLSCQFISILDTKECDLSNNQFVNARTSVKTSDLVNNDFVFIVNYDHVHSSIFYETTIIWWTTICKFKKIQDGEALQLSPMVMSILTLLTKYKYRLELGFLKLGFPMNAHSWKIFSVFKLIFWFIKIELCLGWNKHFWHAFLPTGSTFLLLWVI